MRKRAAQSTFRDQTNAFFDELSRIQEESRKVRDADIERTTGRPYSSLLTQDEEPNDYRPTNYVDEPEVILGRRIM